MRSLRQWKWGILPSYNGFGHNERVWVWQLQSWFTDNGWWEKPKVCSITGRTDCVVWHCENYFDWAHSTFPIQQGMHLCLHNRFKNPSAWHDIVAQYAVTGREWFAKLSLVPVDLAGALRAEHGPEIANIFPRAPVPEGVVIPHHQIYRQPPAAELQQGGKMFSPGAALNAAFGAFAPKQAATENRYQREAEPK